MTYLAAIMLVCSRGDRDLASAVAAEAVAQRVSVELVLAVAAVESGMQGANPMGVMVPSGGRGMVACQRSGRFDTNACIAIGVASLANRLRACRGDFACAARRYHGTGHANTGQYAARVLRIVAFLRGRK